MSEFCGWIGAPLRLWRAERSRPTRNKTTLPLEAVFDFLRGICCGREMDGNFDD